MKALAVEFVLIRDEITADRARRTRIVDAVYGALAGVLLVVGLLRVFYFEKGAAFYFSNVFFLAKLALFLAVGLASIYPTLEFSHHHALGTRRRRAADSVRRADGAGPGTLLVR